MLCIGAEMGISDREPEWMAPMAIASETTGDVWEMVTRKRRRDVRYPQALEPDNAKLVFFFQLLVLCILGTRR